MRKKSAKSSSKAAETAPEIAASIAVETLTEIRAEIRGLLDGSRQRRGDKMVRIALLAQRASQVAAEQRKAAKGEGDAIRRLSPAVVLAWVRQQTAEYRARLVRDVAAIDASERRSVLG